MKSFSIVLLVISSCVGQALGGCNFLDIPLDEGESKALRFQDHQVFFLIKCTQDVLICSKCSGMADSVCEEPFPTAENCERAHQGILDGKPVTRRLGVYGGPYQTSWPNGVLCYQYPSILTANEQSIFMNAIGHIQQNTGVSIIQLSECRGNSWCGGCKNAIRVVRGGGCKSFIGYTSTPNQELSLDRNCFNGGMGTVLHEILHAFGVLHEQAHPKRDLIILRGNKPLPADNYYVQDAASTTNYDPYSVMHYRLGPGIMCIPKDKTVKWCGLNENSKVDNCVIPKNSDCDTTNPLAQQIGHYDVMSKGDIETMRMLYPPAVPAPTASPKYTTTTRTADVYAKAKETSPAHKQC